MLIEIRKDDVKKFVYFITALSKETMYGGLSGKSDLMGGIFDRFINIIPESIIFDNYFLKQISEDYKAIIDFYLYVPVNVGIAPDLIGVNTGKTEVPFATFGKDGWHQYKNAPQIEVKTFKKNQYLVSLRNQQYDGKYLIMLEMNLNSDYLLPFFEDSIYSKEVYYSMRMNNSVFIEKGTSYPIYEVPKISKYDILGTLDLIKVTTATNFMKHSDYCGGKISPHYVKNIVDARNVKNPEYILPLKDLVVLKDRFYEFNDEWYNLIPLDDIVTLSWDICNIENIYIIKVSKSTITIRVINNFVKINDIRLVPDKTYRIICGVLERSGSNGEYFMHKSLIDRVDDFEKEMIKSIKKHIDLNT